MSVMELGHLLTRSGLTYLEVSSEVFHESLCQVGNSFSLSWVVWVDHKLVTIYYASNITYIN